MNCWLWRMLACGLILTAAAVRIGYFAADCPLELAPDEAHYWDWSRHLDYGYYSKGPVVAVLIRAGCSVAGEWSRQLIGSEMIAVRLPAVLCGSLLLLSLYTLTVLIYQCDRLAFMLIALALTLPLISAGSSIMTIDAPYTCLWGWALVTAHLAIFRRAKWAWAATGVLVGCGILAKYTMALFVPALALFLWFTPGFGIFLRRPGFWLAISLAGLCCVPLLVWNFQHDWVSLRHLSGHAGLHSRYTIHWLGPLSYLGAQCGLLLVFWFVVWVGAMWAHAPWRQPRREQAFLWWMSAPMFLVFLLFSLKNGGGEPNWPATAYISGLVLGAGWWLNHLRSPIAAIRHMMWSGAITASILGVALTFFIHQPRAIAPLLARLAGPPDEHNLMPLRRLDPTCRLRGWRTLALKIDALRSKLHAEGIEPVLAGTSWNLPGSIAFYCEGQPTVYSLGLAEGDRHSQYDLWRPNPMADPRDFQGKTFIIVGPVNKLCAAFDYIQPVETVVHREGEHAIARWPVTLGFGFRGCDVNARGQRY